MTLQLSPIRSAIVDVMEGALGSTRKVPSGIFEYREIIGHPQEKIQQYARQSVARYCFDLDIGIAADNRATSASTMGSSRIINIDIRFDVYRFVLSRVDDSTRIDAKDQMVEDLLTAAHALSFAGNLSFTRQGDATSIASGCLTGVETPRTGAIRYDWENHIIQCEIPASAIVQLTY